MKAAKLKPKNTMKTYLINISNHPSDKWDTSQLSAAKNIAEQIIDIPFPMIDASKDVVYTGSYGDIISDLMKKNFGRNMSDTMKMFSLVGNPNNTVIHIMGEMSYTHFFVNKLQAMGYDCICSTTDRIVTENPDGSKNVKFKFGCFRKYEKVKKPDYFNIFFGYKGVAVVESRISSISKPAGEKRQGSEYSTANYEYGYIAYDESGEINRMMIENSIENVISDCKEHDYKIISADEWKLWKLSAGLPADKIFEGIQ